MGSSLRPADDHDLIGIVQATAEAGESLIVEGGGSLARLGGPPAPGARTLDLGAFCGVVDYEPTELVLTARPCTPLIEIEALLAGHGQMLAFEPQDHGPLCGRPRASPTIGGAVASNAGGPRRLVHGAARDHLLGFRAVSGRGEAFKAGGKVVKNVTGFDLSKLMAGSWGTLSVLTEVSIKVLPLAPASATLVLFGLDPARACLAMARALGSSAGITGAAHLPQGAAARVGLSGAGAATLLRLEGFSPTVEVRSAAAMALLKDFAPVERVEDDASRAIWRAVGSVAPLLPLERALWRLSIPAADAPALVDGLEPDRWMLDWAGGLLWLDADAPPGLARGRGHARWWGGADRAFPLQLDEESLKVSRALKAAFDPEDILNRGRLLAPLATRG